MLVALLGRIQQPLMLSHHTFLLFILFPFLRHTLDPVFQSKRDLIPEMMRFSWDLELGFSKSFETARCLSKVCNNL